MHKHSSGKTGLIDNMGLEFIIKTLDADLSDYRKAIGNAFEASQSHVFRWWNEISKQEKKHLLHQIATMDFPFIHDLFMNKSLCKIQTVASAAGLQLTPPNVIPVPVNDQEKISALEARRIGEESLRKGEIAVLTVAGGDGTRLGIGKPKGMLSVAPLSGKSIFQLHAEKIYVIQKKFQVTIPWYLMTSETNDFATREFFRVMHFFGLDPKQVHFFVQRMLPVIDLHGNLLMNSKSNIIMSPNGHGGTITALKEKGILSNMKENGIKNIFYHQVDNVLVRMVDPVFIGYHLKNQAEISLKSVKKLHPEEKVGVIGYINGKLHIIEYSELSQADMYAQNADGSLKYNAANTAIHLMNTEFLEHVCQDGTKLPYHAAKKKVPYMNEAGEIIPPKENNAMKFECFIFDILKHVKRGIVMEVLREDEFSPLKNTEGDNSPVTVVRDINNLFGKWLRNAGIPIPVDAQGNVTGSIEIGAAYAIDEEELWNKIDKGLRFSGTLNLQAP